MDCPLCQSPGRPFHGNEFFLCSGCHGIFRHRESILDPGSERKRYERHENDVNDPGYREFVSPITKYVLGNFKAGDRGLDFGCGPGSAVSKILVENGHPIAQYDPYFADRLEALAKRYDYIVCSEVIEHFNYPAQEFERLRDLLEPGGALVCMTHLYEPGIDFPSWYYKDDETHVFIYQKETLDWIKERYGFKGLKVDGRLIVLTKRTGPLAFFG